MKKLILLLLLSCNLAFAEDIAPPNPSKDMTMDEQQYLKKIADNLNNLTITDTRPNGNRQGRYGDLVGWATNSTVEAYICDSSPNGTSWHKVDTKPISVTPVNSNQLVKAWVEFNGNSAVGVNCTVRASYNVATVTHTANGTYTVNWQTAFTNSKYATVVSINPSPGGSREVGYPSKTAGSVSILAGSAGVGFDVASVSVIAISQ